MLAEMNRVFVIVEVLGLIGAFDLKSSYQRIRQSTTRRRDRWRFMTNILAVTSALLAALSVSTHAPEYLSAFWGTNVTGLAIWGGGVTAILFMIALIVRKKAQDDEMRRFAYWIGHSACLIVMVCAAAALGHGVELFDGNAIKEVLGIG